jgi:His/Glu/Gln/Arg/opine family amino acid ABC transporter permease subunit
MEDRMKKRLLALLIISIITTGLFACNDKDNNVGEETGRSTLIVGFDAEFKPYGYKDDSGEYVGFDLDLAEQVCKRNGWTLVKQPIDWASKDMELNSGSIDCIWNGFTLTGRETDYTWTDAYVDNSQVVVVNTSSGISNFNDLSGKTVVVQQDSSAEAALAGEDATQENINLASSFKALEKVADYNSAFMSLESGVADAICMDVGVAKYELSAREDKFTILSEVISTEEYGIGFKLGNTSLRDAVMDSLYDMLDDGTIEKITNKWGISGVCLGNSESTKAKDLDELATSVNQDDFFTKFLSIAKQLVNGIGATLAIFILTLLFSLPLGLLICAGRRSKIWAIRWIVKFYISVMRGTPLMLQLLVVFFGPFYLFGVSLSSSYRFYAVIIGFTLNYAAYFAEIYRSGIESIPSGQYEAAQVLGYSKFQTFMMIIFPQMVKRVMPPVTNEIITLVKDTSLAFVIAYTEMFTLAKQVAATNSSIMPLFIAGLFYYIFNYVVAFAMERIEKKLGYYK